MSPCLNSTIFRSHSQEEGFALPYFIWESFDSFTKRGGWGQFMNLGY